MHNGKSLISVFREFSASINFSAGGNFHFGWETGHWAIVLAIILWGLGTFHIFPNFLRS